MHDSARTDLWEPRGSNPPGRPSPHSLAVDADPMRLQQILVNLLTNSAKYTDEGGRITIRAGREGGDIVIAVRDTGRGIAPEMVPHLFEMYSQSERTLDRARGGLGIGLAVVDELVRLHGGSIAVASGGVDEGSEFTVRLPSAAPPGEGHAPAKEPGGRRILVIDNDQEEAAGLARFLVAGGHEVVTAGDAATACEIVRGGRRPEVIVLDAGCIVPAGGGFADFLAENGRGLGSLLIAVWGEDGADSLPYSVFHHNFLRPLDYRSVAAVIDRA